VLTLRDAWVATPVAANHLISVAKTLINWGIPREFSEGNPCLAIAKLATEERGACPWPVWAYGLIEGSAWGLSPRRLARPLYRAAPGRRNPHEQGRSEDDGIKVTQQKTRKELWIPLHADLKEEMKRWENRTALGIRADAEGRGLRHRAVPRGLDAANERKASGPDQARGFYVPWSARLERGEPARSRLRRCHDRVTGMSQLIIKRYSRFADQWCLAKAAILQLQRTGQERWL
jgi:hypothetical protein